MKDVASSFEAVNGFLTANKKDGVDVNEISAELSSLAQNYCSSYKPTRQTLKKHGILKKLRQNKNIVICKPDKGNSVVVMNRDDYDRGILEIIRDRKKFAKRNRISRRKKDRDLTIFREDQLNRYLYNLNKAKLLDDDVYDKARSQGAVPARIYGNPKMHKVPRNTADPDGEVGWEQFPKF